MKIAHGIDRLADRLAEESRSCIGHLTGKEVSFLAVLAACSPGDGAILEIGSFKGKSTIVLAKAETAVKGCSALVAVDPLTSPSPTDPALGGASSCRDDFFGNLERAGVRHLVEFHEKLSHELAAEWSQPIRLLWIDGDHTFQGVTADFELFSPFLIPGGVIAFHDVMHCSGVTRVFADRVLRSGLFGCAGIVGSIGWAQCRESTERDPHASDRLRLALQLERHARAARRGESRINKTIAKLLRSRVPRGECTAREYCTLLGIEEPSLASGAVV